MCLRVSYKKKIWKQLFICNLFLKSLKKGVGAGSFSKRYGSTDPDPQKNVTDPHYWLKDWWGGRVEPIATTEKEFWSSSLFLIGWWPSFAWQRASRWISWRGPPRTWSADSSPWSAVALPAPDQLQKITMWIVCSSSKTWTNLLCGSYEFLDRRIVLNADARFGQAVLRIRSGIRCFFDAWILDRGWKKSGSGIRDEHPGSYFQELRNNCWFKKYLNSLTRTRIRYLLNPGSGMEKFCPGSGINIQALQHLWPRF